MVRGNVKKVSGRTRERGDGGRKRERKSRRKRVEVQTEPFLNTKEMRQKRTRKLGQKVKVKNERAGKREITREKPRRVLKETNANGMVRKKKIGLFVNTAH